MKLLHRQHQLEGDIQHLQADLTNKSEQITELAMERDKLQAEVSQLKSTVLQPAVSPVAVLKVIPFKLDDECSDTDDCDDVGPSGLTNTGNGCPHVSSLGELSPLIDEDTSCSHPRQALCVDFTSVIEANSIQCDQQDSRFITDTPIHCQELLEDCSTWLNETPQMHCTSPAWTPFKQELRVQMSPVRNDQYTQTSDVQLKQLALDFEQLSKKLTAAVLQRSASSIAGEAGLSLDSQEQQSHQALA